MTIIIGIDPGQKGGVAWHIDTPHMMRMQNEKMPETEADIAFLFRAMMATDENRFAYLETVHSMPGQGVSSTFKFGRSYGFLRGLLVALEIPFDDVRPQVWQKALGCMSKGDKNVTKQKAQQLFPSLKVTHATADALLIAEYGRRLRLGP